MDTDLIRDYDNSVAARKFVTLNTVSEELAAGVKVLVSRLMTKEEKRMLAERLKADADFVRQILKDVITMNTGTD